MHRVLHVYCDVGVFCLCCGFIDVDINMSENVASNDTISSAKGTMGLC
jgi:hypothetical protein